MGGRAAAAAAGKRRLGDSFPKAFPKAHPEPRAVRPGEPARRGGPPRGAGHGLDRPKPLRRVFGCTIADMDPRPPYELNDPHYHPWLMADGGRAFFKYRSRRTRTAANKWASRREGDPVRRMVIACRDPRCQPPLDE